MLIYNQTWQHITPFLDRIQRESFHKTIIHDKIHEIFAEKFITLIFDYFNFHFFSVFSSFIQEEYWIDFP